MIRYDNIRPASPALHFVIHRCTKRLPYRSHFWLATFDGPAAQQIERLTGSRTIATPVRDHLPIDNAFTWAKRYSE